MEGGERMPNGSGARLQEGESYDHGDDGQRTQDQSGDAIAAVPHQGGPILLVVSQEWQVPSALPPCRSALYLMAICCASMMRFFSFHALMSTEAMRQQAVGSSAP
jgi:hypothetical protein